MHLLILDLFFYRKDGFWWETEEIMNIYEFQRQILMFYIQIISLFVY